MSGVRYKYYVGNAACDASSLDTDITVNGELADKGTTKTYSGLNGTKAGVAEVITFTYTSLSLTKGTLTGTLPVPGVSTDVAYLLDGANLYVSKGRREADGLGDSLGVHAAVKQ